MKEELNWNVVYTGSRQEKKVAQKLTEMQVENYLPLIKVLSQWSDRKKLVEKPLFNGYVFVKPHKRADDIIRTTGVVGFLKYNKANAIVRQHEIETIQSLIHYGYDITVLDNAEQMQVGEKVMVTDGSLKGQIGELYQKKDSKWFIIHFENFGSSIQVKIPSKLLKSIK